MSLALEDKPTPKIEGPQPDNQVQVQIRKPPHCFHVFSYRHFLSFPFWCHWDLVQKFASSGNPPLKRSEARAFLHDPHVLVVHRPVDELDSSVASKKVGRLRQQRRGDLGWKKLVGVLEDLLFFGYIHYIIYILFVCVLEVYKGLYMAFYVGVDYLISYKGTFIEATRFIYVLITIDLQDLERAQPRCEVCFWI